MLTMIAAMAASVTLCVRMGSSAFNGRPSGGGLHTEHTYTPRKILAVLFQYFSIQNLRVHVSPQILFVFMLPAQCVAPFLPRHENHYISRLELQCLAFDSPFPFPGEVDWLCRVGFIAHMPPLVGIRQLPKL